MRQESDRPPAVAESRVAQVARVYALLVETYGIPAWEPDQDALGGLIATVLSQHTSDRNSERAYARLREALPTWEAVRDAAPSDIEEAIRVGGLAAQKSTRIQRILRALSERAGGAAPSLEGLRDLALEDALAYLEALPGVGPKTAACVLLFSLGRPAFPVDTHVWRVARRLGLIGPRVSAAAAHQVLRPLIPPAWRHTLHVDLLTHGRRVCTARRPACATCPLRGECDYVWRTAARGAHGGGTRDVLHHVIPAGARR